MRISRRHAMSLIASVAGASAVSEVARAQSMEVFPRGHRLIAPEQYRSLPKAPETKGALPNAVFLDTFVPPIGKQSPHSSCTCWAAVYTTRSYYVRRSEQQPADRWYADYIPSPGYVYGSLVSGSCDEGTSYVDVFNVLGRGVPSLREYPYDRINCAFPTAQWREYATAERKFTISAYRTIDPLTVRGVQGQLALGHPVMFSMPVGSTFDRLGRATYKGPRGSDVGSHAMVISGYTSQYSSFRVVNSWGTDWGDRGFAWVSYDTFEAEAQEAFVMVP
jgi:C1A family cysteine protease